jgi:beta-carotene ketolase (CrtW type)
LLVYNPENSNGAFCEYIGDIPVLDCPERSTYMKGESEIQKMIPEEKTLTHRGVIIALLLIAAWSITLIWTLSQKSELFHPAFQIALIAILTHLYTGLFITAHDSMHGSVAPYSKRLNDTLGRLCLVLYGWLDFDYLNRQHQLHHKTPGTQSDPDFFTGSSCFLWYLNFMRYYITLKQLCLMSMTFSLGVNLILIPSERLLLFWALPSLLSSLQLFYFGTYRPHYPDSNQPFMDEHRARSPVARGRLWSLLTCYNFGAYHLEHHHYPATPWWNLPKRPLCPPQKETT